MNSNVHPMVVALVLFLTGIAVATWMWGSAAAANIGGPAELKTDSRGHAYVQIQDKLVEHDASGQFLRTHELRDMGLDLFLGTFDFFSNGDILLRRGPDSRSFSDNFRAYQRKSNLDSIEPDTPSSGLFRCELDTKYCARFGQPGVDFKAAHGIFVDRDTDEVYISDTTRHVLRKYSSDGTALAGPVSGFKFPNQLLIADQKLFVADTNHHEIRVVDPSTESFGEKLESHNVVPETATAARQIWPSHFIRSGDRWWVNNMRNGMNQGGIYLFDESWRLIRKLKLPDDSDPIALLAFGDEVWISDWYNDKVHRFSISGEPLPDLESAGLESVLAQSRTKRRSYEMISYSGIALIVLVLGGLAVRGMAVGMSTDVAVSDGTDADSTTQAPKEDLHLEPDTKMVQKMKFALRMLIFMLFVAFALVGYIVLVHLKPEFGIEFIWPGIGMIAAAFLIAWINRSNVGTAITLKGNTVTLRDYGGRESSCSLREIRYDDSAIATQNIVVFLGRPMASVYNRKDLKEKLFPRLAGAQKLSAWQMQSLLVQKRHPQGITAVLAFVGVALYIAWELAS